MAVDHRDPPWLTMASDPAFSYDINRPNHTESTRNFPLHAWSHNAVVEFEKLLGPSNDMSTWTAMPTPQQLEDVLARIPELDPISILFELFERQVARTSILMTTIAQLQRDLTGARPGPPTDGSSLSNASLQHPGLVPVYIPSQTPPSYHQFPPYSIQTSSSIASGDASGDQGRLRFVNDRQNRATRRRASSTKEGVIIRVEYPGAPAKVPLNVFRHGYAPYYSSFRTDKRFSLPPPPTNVNIDGTPIMTNNNRTSHTARKTSSTLEKSPSPAGDRLTGITASVDSSNIDMTFMLDPSAAAGGRNRSDSTSRLPLAEIVSTKALDNQARLNTPSDQHRTATNTEEPLPGQTEDLMMLDSSSKPSPQFSLDDHQLYQNDSHSKERHDQTSNLGSPDFFIHTPPLDVVSDAPL
ncbi:uncharacterized protein V1516DRAFT_675737 [Lipomyces oligophaga]|uniref:uncharacterized protein n=1 Tax=Lipomyces oligophaga TaxID=45792 RepID=UPI0034CFBDA4